MYRIVMKSASEKLKEIIDIFNKLKELGISDDLCKDLKNFRKISNDFIKSDTSFQGKIRLIEIDRELVYLLSVQPNIQSHAYLKYKEIS